MEGQTSVKLSLQLRPSKWTFLSSLSFDRRWSSAICFRTVVRTHTVHTAPSVTPRAPLSLSPPNQTWMCLYVLSPPPRYAPCLSSPLLLRGYCRGGKKQTSSYTGFHQCWNLPELHEQESIQWQALACEVWGGVPGTCATSHTPPGRTSPTVCPRCPCRPHHSPSSWERVPLSCETSSGEPGRGGGGNTH